MRLKIALLCLSLGLLAPVCAHANPINPDVTFYLYNGTVNYGGLAYGSVTINTATGALVSEDIHIDHVFVPDVGYTVNYVFSGPFSFQGSTGSAYGGEIFSLGNGSAYDLELLGGSLVGYTGGSLCTTSNYLCPGLYTTLYTGDPVENVDYEIGGYLSPLSPTPEPSSLLLLGTGMVVAAVAVRRGFRSN